MCLNEFRHAQQLYFEDDVFTLFPQIICISYQFCTSILKEGYMDDCTIFIGSGFKVWW
jgi:hypothetical protein